MPEPNFRTYVEGMKAAAKEFDRLVAARLLSEAEAEEVAKQAEKLARKARAKARGSRGA